MKVLLHSDFMERDHFGIWWADPNTGNLKDLYREQYGPQRARGALIVYNKTDPDYPWWMWFDYLATRMDPVESWNVYDSAGLSPQQLLESLRPPPRVL